MTRLLSSVLPRQHQLVTVVHAQVDIIHKYNADEARNLKQYGELPETARINETAVDMAMVVCSAEINLSLRILNHGLHAIDASTRLTG